MTINFSHKLSSERSLYYKRSFSLFGTNFDDRPKILIYRKISKTFKNIKAIQEAVAYKEHICAPPIWIGLTDFDISSRRWWCEDSFFSDYHYSKWYQKHRVFNSLFAENNCTAVWNSYFDPTSWFLRIDVYRY